MTDNPLNPNEHDVRDVRPAARCGKEAAFPCTTRETVWEVLDRGAPPKVIRALLGSVDPSDTVTAWLQRRSPIEVLSVWGEHLPGTAARLRPFGLDPVYTSAAASDSFEQSAVFAEEYGSDTLAESLRRTGANIAGATAQSSFFKLLLKLQGGFSRLAAGLGFACTVCPFTGATVTSRHAVPVALDQSKQVCLFYRFKSVQTFYVVVSSFSGGKEFLYIPGCNLLLRLHEPDFAWGEAQDMVMGFDRLTMENAEEFAAYIEADTRRCVLAGVTDNLGHSLWNDLTGLEAFVSEGLLSDVATGLSYRHEQLNAFSMFRDLHVLERELSAGDPVSLLRTIFSERLFCFRPSFYAISPAVADRILRYAEAHVSPEQKQAAMEARRAAHVIWINFRRHNKSWLNVLEVIPRAIAGLVRQYGTVAVFADGMPDCEEHGEELRRRLPDGATLFTGFNLPLVDSIYWSASVDSFIATIGSGLTLVTWIAARPGIAHSESAHLTQLEFWGEVRPDAPLPLVPERSDIRDIGSGMYCDYEICEDAMLRLFDKLAAMVPPRSRDSNGRR